MIRRFRHILLTGATGQLGQHICASGKFLHLLTPPRKELDLCSSVSVQKYFKTHHVDAVIHTAAVARMKEAEQKPGLAIETNIMGTCRLVEVVLQTEKRNKPARFIHISTDGVYAGARGHYRETDPTIPYNRYGWTKLGAECGVRLLRNFCIIRTRFFDASHIPFKKYPIDAYSSSLPVEDLVEAIHVLLHSDFVGTINVGHKRLSHYARNKKAAPSIQPCRLKAILTDVPFTLSKDASMNCRLWENIQHQSSKYFSERSTPK